MWAEASVDIDGNNYAPIRIQINFDTNIHNYGGAAATTGNVAAGNAGSPSSAAAVAAPGASGTSGSSGSTKSSGSSGSTSSARGGSSIAIGNSVDANVVSQQLGSANGSHPLSSTVITGLLNSLPHDDLNPFASNDLPGAAIPTPEAGMTSRGGDAIASGMQSTIEQHNTQLAACEDPRKACLARNASFMEITSEDVAPNPVDPNARKTNPDDPNAPPCAICSTTHFTGVNATPSPTPKPSQATNNQATNNQSHGSSGGHRSQSQVTFGENISGEFIADGYTVMVDLWDQWPGRRLPPMPNPTKRTATGGDVNVSLNGWPGVDELPLPELQSESVPDSAASSVRVRLPAARSQDQGADTEDDDAIPPLGIYTVAAAGWPDAALLPMPAQAKRLVAVPETPEVAGVGVGVGVAAEPSDAGGTGVEPGPALLLALVLGVLGGSKRGRRLLPTVATSVLHFRPGELRLVRQTVRTLATARLALGVLRLWILSIFRA